MNTPRIDQATRQDRHTEAINDLLAELFNAETAYPYGWPLSSAEQYGNEIEAQVSGFAEIPATEWDSRAQAFFAQVESCWPATASSLVESLQSKFSENIPTDWLTAIAAQAQQLTTAGLSPIEQLVECVKPLLTDWSVDDLQVFARPLAYAMRSGAPAAELPDQAWDTLSPVEQARSLLQVAKCALDEVQAEQHQA
jgi:hypothetical protein